MKSVPRHELPSGAACGGMSVSANCNDSQQDFSTKAVRKNHKKHHAYAKKNAIFVEILTEYNNN